MKNKDSLREEYGKCWTFFKESKDYFYFSVALFFLMALIGFLFPVFFRDQIVKVISQIILRFEGLGVYETTFLIFGNNSMVALVSIIGGFVVGLLPLWYLVSNGYLIGFISSEMASVHGFWELWRLLPHGIFEIPAILFSMAFGLKIGHSLFRRKMKTREIFLESMRFYILVVVPLLFLAAIIEGILIFF